MPSRFIEPKAQTFRHGKAIRPDADPNLCRAVGDRFIAWWQEGPEVTHATLGTGPDNREAFKLDLRQAMLSAMSQDQRRCSTAGMVFVVGTIGMVKPEAFVRAAEIGREVLTWWDDPGGRHKLCIPSIGATIDIRPLIEHSLKCMEVYRSREEPKD